MSDSTTDEYEIQGFETFISLFSDLTDCACNDYYNPSSSSSDPSPPDAAATTTNHQKQIVKGLMVQRLIRTYHPCNQTQIPIVVLPGLPRSGIPHHDIQSALATHHSRSRINALLILNTSWLCFSLLCAISILCKMTTCKSNDMDIAYKVFCIVIAVGIPFAAGFLNYWRFFAYKKWLIDKGTVTVLVGATPEVDSTGKTKGATQSDANMV